MGWPPPQPDRIYLWKFWPIFAFIKWQHNPKYGNLLRNLNIYLPEGGDQPAFSQFFLKPSLLWPFHLTRLVTCLIQKKTWVNFCVLQWRVVGKLLRWQPWHGWIPTDVWLLMAPGKNLTTVHTAFDRSCWTTYWPGGIGQFWAVYRANSSCGQMPVGLEKAEFGAGGSLAGLPGREMAFSRVFEPRGLGQRYPWPVHLHLQHCFFPEPFLTGTQSSVRFKGCFHLFSSLCKPLPFAHLWHTRYHICASVIQGWYTVGLISSQRDLECSQNCGIAPPSASTLVSRLPPASFFTLFIALLLCPMAIGMYFRYIPRDGLMMRMAVQCTLPRVKMF